MVEHTFDPIIDNESKLLILGSFPSVKSRVFDFYYMHPQNRFWDVLEKVFNDRFTTKDIEEKKLLLKKHHIAIFDVIKSCEITGSDDASISSVKVHDIDSLIENTQIKYIFLNGKKAQKLFNTYFPSLKHKSRYLPSTSSANARYQLKDLIKEWQVIAYETI